MRVHFVKRPVESEAQMVKLRRQCAAGIQDIFVQGLTPIRPHGETPPRKMAGADYQMTETMTSTKWAEAIA